MPTTDSEVIESIKQCLNSWLSKTDRTLKYMQKINVDCTIFAWECVHDTDREGTMYYYIYYF